MFHYVNLLLKQAYKSKKYKREEVIYMKFSEKYNKGARVFDIETKDFEFATLSGLYDDNADKVYKLDGLYINKKGMYDPHPVAVVSDLELLVDLPSHMTDTVNEILKDAESIDLIKKGCVGFKIRQYRDEKYGKTCYSAEWVDL